MAWDFAFGLGSGLSAPLSMLIALAVLTVSVARRGRRRSVLWIGFLGWCFLMGMLVEPILGDAIRGELDLLVTTVIVVNVQLPIVILSLAIRTAHKAERGVHGTPWVELPSG
ncbi:MAG: hypothetical protein WD313_02840 [Acidimicrobiia bacterium]